MSDTALKTPAFSIGESFAPGANNTRAYRDALGAFSTGVTLITTITSSGPVCMTVNSFASVSLEPALVLWSLSKSSGRFEPFSQAKNYSIHVLGEEHAGLATWFGKQAVGFDKPAWIQGEHGIPVLTSALARFDCTHHASHEAGDHVIIIGSVDNVVTNEGKPLVFAKGGFGGFSSTD